MVQIDKTGEVWCKSLTEAKGVCPRGMIPTLNRENHEIWNLFLLMLPGLQRMEGYDYNAIRLVTDTRERETGKFLTMEMLADIIKLIRVLSKERQKRNEDKK